MSDRRVRARVAVMSSIPVGVMHSLRLHLRCSEFLRLAMTSKELRETVFEMLRTMCLPKYTRRVCSGQTCCPHRCTPDDDAVLVAKTVHPQRLRRSSPEYGYKLMCTRCLYYYNEVRFGRNDLLDTTEMITVQE